MSSFTACIIIHYSLFPSCDLPATYPFPDAHRVITGMRDVPPSTLQCGIRWHGPVNLDDPLKTLDHVRLLLIDSE